MLFTALLGGDDEAGGFRIRFVLADAKLEGVGEVGSLLIDFDGEISRITSAGALYEY